MKTGRELQALSRVLAEQTARSLQTVDRVTPHIADEYRSGKLDALADEAALHAYLRDQAVGLVQVAGLSIIDADGRVRASSSRYPMPAEPPNVAAVPGFQQLEASRTPELLSRRAAGARHQDHAVAPRRHLDRAPSGGRRVGDGPALRAARPHPRGACSG